MIYLLIFLVPFVALYFAALKKYGKYVGWVIYTILGYHQDWVDAYRAHRR